MLTNVFILTDLDEIERRANTHVPKNKTQIKYFSPPWKVYYAHMYMEGYHTFIYNQMGKYLNSNHVNKHNGIFPTSIYKAQKILTRAVYTDSADPLNLLSYMPYLNTKLKWTNTPYT